MFKAANRSRVWWGRGQVRTPVKASYTTCKYMDNSQFTRIYIFHQWLQYNFQHIVILCILVNRLKYNHSVTNIIPSFTEIGKWMKLLKQWCGMLMDGWYGPSSKTQVITDNLSWTHYLADLSQSLARTSVWQVGWLVCQENSSFYQGFFSEMGKTTV